jgi:hypothetical protein
MKSRRCKHDKYPTTFIGKNKVDEAKANPSITHIFVYAYEDGLYYVEYEATLFDSFKITEFQRTARFGIIDRPKPTIEIPISHLKKITV